MLQTTEKLTVEERIISLIGDAGAVTPRELVVLLGEEDFRADEWLRGKADTGYLERDEFGRYGTSCHWPRVGF
jgi:hypothetical protein